MITKSVYCSALILSPLKKQKLHFLQTWLVLHQKSLTKLSFFITMNQLFKPKHILGKRYSHYETNYHRLYFFYHQQAILNNYENSYNSIIIEYYSYLLFSQMYAADCKCKFSCKFAACFSTSTYIVTETIHSEVRDSHAFLTTGGIFKSNCDENYGIIII